MHPDETEINDYVDDGLDATARAGVERHLATCETCRRTVEELRAIVRIAGELDLREPSFRAWPRIERAIRMEPGFGGGAVSGPAEAGHSQKPVDAASAGRKAPRYAYAIWLAAVAALVLATTVGIRYKPMVRSDAPVTTATSAGTAIPGGGDAADAAGSLETEMRQAEQHYEKAIKGLEQIATADQGALDARTAATLQKNLAVVDQAIGESRAAVRSQPASEPAQQSLIESFKTKIGLLEDTVSLINEMRKGNEAGAARIVSGLKTKGN